MPQLDGAKERSVYLRLWLGIAAAAEISLIGWFISSAESATARLFALAVAGIILLGVIILMLHRHIERYIREVRSL
jgi:hypothetical protein